jgi:hypothetical protein
MAVRIAEKTAGRVSAAAASRLSLGLGSLEGLAGGVGGALGMLWFAWDGFTEVGKGYSKDAALDFISAAGCMIGIIGLTLDSTLFAAIPGIVFNIVGFSMVLIAQLLKYFRTFSGKNEDFCRFLYGESLEDGGAGQLDQWKKDLKSNNVLVPWEVSKLEKINELTDRVDEFLKDWDTFDKFE